MPRRCIVHTVSWHSWSSIESSTPRSHRQSHSGENQRNGSFVSECSSSKCTRCSSCSRRSRHGISCSISHTRFIIKGQLMQNFNSFPTNSTLLLPTSQPVHTFAPTRIIWTRSFIYPAYAHCFWLPWFPCLWPSCLEFSPRRLPFFYNFPSTLFACSNTPLNKISP